MKKAPVYYLASWISQFASIFCLFVAFLCFLPYISKYLMVGDFAPYVKHGLHLEASLRAFVKSIIPTVMGGHDLSRFIVLAVSLCLTGIFSDVHQRYRYLISYESLKEDVNIQKALTKKSEKAELFEQKMVEMQATTSRRNRESLLKELMVIKKELDSFGRDLAFLSVDVVNSTKMKDNEDKMMVEYDFDQYRQFAQSKLLQHGCVKFSWTGDGLMSCFNTVDAAVSAGKDIISGLASLNATKNIKTDFAVRCGVNSGYIYFDDSKPLDQITDRAIDIAGHMQKYAETNTICIAKGIVEPVQNSVGFAPANRLVDGYETYEWHHENEEKKNS